MKVCYYHNDLDGICSAAIVRKAHPDAKFIACVYDKPVPLFRQENVEQVFLVDFSFERWMMDEIRGHPEFVWIDHHKSSKEKLSDIWNDDRVDGFRDLDLAACELTWQWFFPDIPTPKAVEYIGDYDMWEFEHANTKAFFETAHALIDSPESEYWNTLLSLDSEFYHSSNQRLLEEFINSGDILLKAKQKRIEQAFKQGSDVMFSGYKTRVMNTNQDISDVGAYAVRNGYQIGLIWFVYQNHISVGLRSLDVDVSEIATKYGGGGHRLASGFQTKPSFLNELLWTKKT